MKNIPLSAEDEAYALNYRDDMTSPHGMVEPGNGIATRNNVVLNYFT